MELFHVSEYLTIHGNGQIELTEKEIDVLNEQLKLAGFEERLVADLSPKFVVGYVKAVLIILILIIYTLLKQRSMAVKPCKSSAEHPISKQGKKSL